MPKMTKKHNTPWTTTEVKKLRMLARTKLRTGRTASSRFAASVLGRTHGAVKYKAMMEGISFQNTRQPRGVQKRIARRRK